MRFLLCGSLALFLPLLGLALDLFQSTDLVSFDLRRIILLIPFAALALVHLVVIGAAAAGPVAFGM